MVTAVSVTDNQAVRKGEVLFRIDDRTIGSPCNAPSRPRAGAGTADEHARGGGSAQPTQRSRGQRRSAPVL